MRTPSTSAGCYFFMDPSKKYVQLASAYGNTATALQVGTLTDRISGKPITAGSSAAPVWASNSFYGTFAKYGSGSGSHLANQQAGLTFNGTTQCLEFDYLASTLASGTEPSLTVVCQAQCTSAAGSNQTLWAFGGAGTAPILQCAISDGYLVLTEHNGSTYTATYTSFTGFGANNTAANVITAVRTNNLLTLRVNGVQVQTAALTAATNTFTTFCVGALNSNGSTSDYFTGVIGKLIAYGSPVGGIADIVDLEKDLMLDSGIVEF